MFDHVLLMMKGGRTAFSGDVLGALKHFENIGLPCPLNTNPADWMLDVLQFDEEMLQGQKMPPLPDIAGGGLPAPVARRVAPLTAMSFARRERAAAARSVH
jgi:hypothetical protein